MKKKTLLRLTSSITTLCFAMTLCVPAFAAESTTFTENNIKYEVTDSATYYVEVVPHPNKKKAAFRRPFLMV